MKKYLIYWGIFIAVCAVLFALWWTRPANYIERITTLNVAAEETLFSQSTDSATVYLLKTQPLYVKKVIDGCELHGGSFASVDKTGAVKFGNDAAFKAHGLFKSNNIGCLIKGAIEKESWEIFVKDDLLYFQLNH
ncbi:hypothetical protein [Cellvibrio mixtus]|uniref:hypothetical protein n=1 Tax=Cellvibrio mixtus TaxID=39650 RepID=UPI00058768CB|nr:hypothetical protein [Cellvibrio mixtus]